MKKIATFLICTFVLVATLETLSSMDSVPANRNILNPAKLTYTIDTETDPISASVHTLDPFVVEAGEAYTLSFPTIIGSDTHVKVESLQGQEGYINQRLDEATEHCVEDLSKDRWSCTFTPQFDDLTITLEGGNNLANYLSFAQSKSIQLEKGLESTSYIPYEPLIETPPVFIGESDLYVSYHEPPSLTTIIAQNIEVHDEIDGSIPSSEIQIINDPYTGQENTVGTYTVTLEASDSAGNTASFDLHIHVYDAFPPMIEGPSTIDVDVNDRLDAKALIQTHFSFTDGHDGELSNFDITADTYSEALNTLGESALTFSVQDASGNTSSHTLTIHTKDYDPPVISGPDALTIHQSSMQTLESILNQYDVTDNHTATALIEVTHDSGGYALDASSGEYTLTIDATDASGNKRVKTVALTVIDDIPPIMYADSHHRISYTEAFDLDAYIESIHIEENDDATLTNTAIKVVSNAYVKDVPGTYAVEFELEDQSGNIATHTLTIDVVDDVPPVFTVVASVHASVDGPLSVDMLQSMLMNDSELETFTPVAYTVLEDEYTGNEDKEGAYLYTVEYSNASGDTMVKSLDIQVASIIEEDTQNITPLLTTLSIVTLMGYGLWNMKRR